MFLKLCKHEIKNTYKGFLILYLLLLLAAYSITAILINEGGSPYGLQWLIFYPVMIVVTSVGSEILILRACYISMYSKTGYLTHTLPVSATALYMAKLTVYSIWMILSYAIILASVALILSAIPDFHMSIDPTLIIRVTLAIITQLVLSVTIILAALGFAHSKYIRNSRLTIGVLIFFLIDFIVEFIGTHLPNADYINHPIFKELIDMPIFNQWTTPLGIGITLALIVLLSMFSIYFINNKMELE